MRFLRLSIIFHLLAWVSPIYAQANDWRAVPLQGTATAFFPGSPSQKTVEKGEFTGRGYVLNMDSAIYSIAVIEGPHYNNSRPTEADLNDYYKGMLDGLVKREKVKIVSQKFVKLSDFNGIEIKYILPSQTQLPAEKYLRAVLVGEYTYMLQFWTYPECDVKQAANREKFFNSFKPGISKNSLPEASSSQIDAYEAGKIAGSIFFYFLLGLGLFFFAFRLKRAK